MVKNDNQIIQVFLPIINDGLIAAGFSGVSVRQGNQPTQQGTPSNPAIFFFKISSRRYGHLGRGYKWDAAESEMIRSESQYIESTWQISALVRQLPATPDQYTSSDLVNEAASIMQSDKTRDILNREKIGILRVTDILTPYFVDDSDNFAASPSFDFVLTYENIRSNTSPIINEFNSNLIGV